MLLAAKATGGTELLAAEEREQNTYKSALAGLDETRGELERAGRRPSGRGPCHASATITWT
jgi:hypothetical protein